MMEECFPLKTLEETLCWKNKIPVNTFTVPLAKRMLSAGSKTLICHDLKGGYLNDRFVHGIKNENCYNFVHWSLIDVFVYFSHSLVTVPPYGWISAAHKNGTLILGTFITEWEEGEKICEEFLKDMTSIEELCSALVGIAVNCDFDGWLINIENKLKFHQVRCLIEFVNVLTKQMHKAKANSLVIWYDSVIESGQLQWQNCLNEENRVFFDNCDGIFLNYNWTEQNLKQSVVEAGQRLTDVYVGVDVFGRGCPGGGGFNTDIAMKALKRHGLSAAIFAPGWVYECLDQQCFWENQYKFWESLESYCCIGRLKSLPFATSFCPGYGTKMYRKGKVIGSESWFNMGLQQIQPSFLHSEKGFCKKVSVISTEDAFDGGGCLKLKCTKPNNGTVTESFRIMSTSFCVIKNCVLTYTFKLQCRNVGFALNLDMCALGKPYSTMLVDSKTKNKFHNCNNGIPGYVVELACDEVEKYLGYVPEVPNNGWETRYFFFDVSKYKGHVIENVNAAILYCSDQQCCDASVLLGYLEISPVREHSYLKIMCAHEDSDDEKIQLDCILGWNNEQSVCYWDVFYSLKENDEKYLGTTSVPYFNIHLQLKKSELTSNVIFFHLYSQQNYVSKPFPKQSICRMLQYVTLDGTS